MIRVIDAPSSSSRPQARPPRTLTAGLLLVILAVAFESMAVSTVLPRVAADLRGLELYGWASSAFLLASLFGAVLAGFVTDRRGVAVSAALGIGVFAVGLSVAGAAPSMTVFVLSRFVQGLGAGGLGALPFAVIRARYPEEARASMLAAVSSAWLLPALVGPLLASLVADAWSWRAVFWGLAPLVLLVAPLCVLPLREERPTVPTSRASAGLRFAFVLAASAGALIEGFRRADGLGAVLMLLGGGGVVWSVRVLFPRGMWRLLPGLPAALVTRGFAAFAVLGASSFLPLALNELRGLTLTQAGWLLSVGGVTWSAGSFVQSRLDASAVEASRIGRVRLGMAGVTVGLAFTALAVFGVTPLWTAYAGWALSGFSMGVGYNANSLFALGSVNEQQAGRLSGQLANIEVLMTAIAAGLVGAFIARVSPLGTSFVLAFAATLAASLMTWLGASRLRRSS
ncbi:MFS transporter [Deinococcus yavapaiensis]|uniref:MFS transporter n=1 Tax=Deinococcus yavapaiensis KR-236 TaxID=694435 RepID=A0A318S8V2_9DEIO|nr:MFS transporter [Deinococcus yavapaiensis]PYE55466.1 MFS transporter [Deinococcus yavapaiensis KR-236]